MNLSPLRKLPLDKPRILWQGSSTHIQWGYPSLKSVQDLARKGVFSLYCPSCREFARPWAPPLEREYNSGFFYCPKLEFNGGSKMTSSDLIPTGSAKISGQEILTVNARDLHQFLEVGRDYTNWIKDRITEYDFKENDDFVCSPDLASKKGRGGHNRIDYHITLDMGKELAMVERTEKGRAVRKYFIECERRAKESARTLPPPDQPRRLPSPGLTPEQQRAVQVLIGERVYATDNKAMYPQMFRTTYRRIKDKFLVAKYDQVPQGRFEELVAFINSLFAPVSKPTVSVSRDEFESFVKEYRIRNKVMNEYLDDIWATGNGILSVAKRLGELDGDLTGIAVKAIRTRAYESIVADIEATRNETQSILGSLLDTTRLFFVKHSKINHRMPDECARISGRV